MPLLPSTYYISIQYASELYYKSNISFLMKQKHNNTEIFNTASIISCLIYDISTKENACYIDNERKEYIWICFTLSVKPKKGNFKYW